jgi:hypothetical protein
MCSFECHCFSGILKVLRHEREVHGFLDLKLTTAECGPLGSPDIIYERGEAVKNVKDNGIVRQK